MIQEPEVNVAVQSSTAVRVRHALFLVADRLLDWLPNPYARASALRVLGAQIGSNVRIHSIRLANLESGVTNLRIDDDAHVGTDCLLDLSEVVHIGAGAVLAPRVNVLTHQDAGRHHGSALAEVIGTRHRSTSIGPGAFIGAGATVLCGADVGHHAVVAAGAVVAGPVEPGVVVGGVPASVMRSLRAELAELGIKFDGETSLFDGPSTAAVTDQ